MIINNKKEVNTFIEDIQVINEKINQEQKYIDDFMALVPKPHQKTVFQLVNKFYKGNFNEYFKTIPLFFEPLIWNRKKKEDADEKFLSNRSNRDKKRYKKQLILHSAQLLKLIGFNRQKHISLPMAKMYVDDMMESDFYLSKLRLINSKGKVLIIETNLEKQHRNLARLNKIADTIDLLAQDKGFTNSMITLTLPPSYHPNPKNNNCSYKGYSPEKASKLLRDIWKSFRAMLSNNGFVFGVNAFGLSVVELQGDSCLHLHSVIYHSKEDEELIAECLKKVESNYNKKQTDIKEMCYHDIQHSNQNLKGKDYQRGSSYMMKYLYKTHTTYDEINLDDEALKNQAGRWFYGIRSFAFFGLNESITRFEFLVKNWQAYEIALPDEIKLCLKANDMYTYLKNFDNKNCSFFSNEYHKEGSKKTFIGVSFNRKLYKQHFKKEQQDKLVLELMERLENEIIRVQERMERFIGEGNLEQVNKLHKVIERKFKKLSSLETTNEFIQEKIDSALSSFDVVLMEKRIFSVFQSNISNEDITNIKTISLEDVNNSNVECAFEKAKEKQNNLNQSVKYKKEFYEKKFNLKVLTLKKITSISKTLDKSIPVHLIKAVQGKGVNPDKREKFRQDVLNKLNL